MERSIRSMLIEQIVRIANQQKKVLAPLSDGLPLLDSGLDSLCFAVLVAHMDDTLDVDPFGVADDIEFPVTLGDLVRLYEQAVPLTPAYAGVSTPWGSGSPSSR